MLALYFTYMLVNFLYFKKIVALLAFSAITGAAHAETQTYTLDFTTTSAAIGEPGQSYTYQDFDIAGDGSLTADITLTASGLAGGVDHIAQGWGHTAGNDQLNPGEIITISFSDFQGSAAAQVTGLQFVGFVSHISTNQVFGLSASDEASVNGVNLISFTDAQTSVPSLNWTGNGAYDLESTFYGNTASLIVPTSGNFEITTTADSFRLAGIQITAGPIEELVPAAQPVPENFVLASHPDSSVSVFFNPTAAWFLADSSLLDLATSGGTWSTSTTDLSAFQENLGGHLYVMDGVNNQNDFIELTIDNGGVDFSQEEVALNFDILGTRASANNDKEITVTGYNGNIEVFRLTYLNSTSRTGSFITAHTGSGAQSMSFTPLRAVAPTAVPSGLQDLRIQLNNGEVEYSGSSLDTVTGSVLNNATHLTSVRWEITGSSTGNQGFWLDEVQIRNRKPESREATDRPNVLFVLLDDFGYRDLSSYGATSYESTNIDRLANEGIKGTNFVTSANVCSPSRASFLTGAYCQRAGLPAAISLNSVPRWFLGLHPNEITIAEQVRERGYRTMMTGKWHLGWHSTFLPRNQGFDHYYGLEGNLVADSPFLDDDEQLFPGTPQLNIVSGLYNQHIRQQIRENHDRPFFIYYSHNYPHTPFQEGNAFNGSTGSGTRPDVLKELDWSIGQLISELKANGILENTIVIFTSDNGATSNANNTPLRGTKWTTFEGGHRVPFIMYWKDQIIPRVIDERLNAMDVFPTISELAGQPLPTDRVYDGVSLVPAFNGQPIIRPSEQEPYYYYSVENLQAVRLKIGERDWKLHVPRDAEDRPDSDRQAASTVFRLYDLATDVAENNNLASANPAVVTQLTQLADQIRQELGEYGAEPPIVGSGVRATGTLFPEVPIILNRAADFDNYTLAEQGRGVTRFPGEENYDGIQTALELNSPTSDYVAGSLVPPAGWSYHTSNEVINGNESSMTGSSAVGSQGNEGFVGAGNAAVAIRDTTGSFVINSGNTGNNTNSGSDILITTDVSPQNDHTIIRYTITPEDVSFARESLDISGSFRDLIPGDPSDQVNVAVYHNNTQLFSGSGSNGTLSQVNGSFNLQNLNVNAGDTLSFIVGNEGNSSGDEVALIANLEFNEVSIPTVIDLTLNSLDQTSGLGSFSFFGTPRLNYQIQRTTSLNDASTWETVDEIPYMSTQQPFALLLPTNESDEKVFWRVMYTEN